jgi:hypothetical protein
VKVERKIEVVATPAEAFAKISDVGLVSSLFRGFMDWYPTDQPNRFRTVFRAGPAPLGGEVEVEFWPETMSVVWHATRGVHNLGRFLIRQKDVGSEISFRIFYHLDGGIASRLAEWVFALTVDRFVRVALERLRKSIEAQPPRHSRARRKRSPESSAATS